MTYKHTCLKCKSTWQGYLENPIQCPRCHRNDWNKPKKQIEAQELEIQPPALHTHDMNKKEVQH